MQIVSPSGEQQTLILLFKTSQENITLERFYFVRCYKDGAGFIFKRQVAEFIPHITLSLIRDGVLFRFRDEVSGLIALTERKRHPRVDMSNSGLVDCLFCHFFLLQSGIKAVAALHRLRFFLLLAFFLRAVWGVHKKFTHFDLFL
jgi:hypothetical protein